MCLSRNSEGLPRTNVLEERIALVVVAISTLWMALVSSWEMLGPVLSEHWAAAASTGIIAENMLEWGIIGPVWDYPETRPAPELYYCHHPWGIFWVTTLFMKVFGRHDVVCRLPVLFAKNFYRGRRPVRVAGTNSTTLDVLTLD